MKRILYLVLVLTLGVSFSSCKKDTPTTTIDPAQSTALTSGYWEYARTDDDGMNRQTLQFTFKTDMTYTMKYLREEFSEQYKDHLSTEFNDEYYASGRYSLSGNQVKLETFQLDRYADRFVGHRSKRDMPKGIVGIVLIFDQQAQTLTPSLELSPEDAVDPAAVLLHKH